ncbi:hypothetical protein V6N11_070860 [Hibiscus sabdariffa]|uniref:Helicase C-terminal domain-containing protein n=1 Tax=Hibiscus sabdariffa TaxID=183260 RepID=A0ABR1ZX20_9ROSI
MQSSSTENLWLRCCVKARGSWYWMRAQPEKYKIKIEKGFDESRDGSEDIAFGYIISEQLCEYFNTLCLSRPKFVHEVLRQLDPKYKKKRRFDKARNLLENRARKFFLDKIARKIDAGIGDERLQGLNMLRNITNGFIDVYEVWSGLRTAVPKFFSAEELLQLEKIKFDFRKGSKVMFVLNLVYRIIKNEKVLIFCHNIAPINLLVEMFERIFQWRKGREILVLTGDLELFERGRVMDQFEEQGGASRVLIASITACAEGISLTAASRVILLDSEWNPSKTKQAIARAFRPGQQKVVYVYQLLATSTLEEDKYRRTTWKEWVSSMIFSEASWKIRLSGKQKRSKTTY